MIGRPICKRCIALIITVTIDVSLYTETRLVDEVKYKQNVPKTEYSISMRLSSYILLYYIGSKGKLEKNRHS